MPKCKFCNKEIFWMREGRKNKPHDMDGGEHKCTEMKKTLDSTKVIRPTELSPEEIAQYESAINQKKDTTKIK